MRTGDLNFILVDETSNPGHIFLFEVPPVDEVNVTHPEVADFAEDLLQGQVVGLGLQISEGPFGGENRRDHCCSM